MKTQNNAKELVKHVIARRQAAFHIELCEFANMRVERRNRKIGEIRRLCDYDVANAPRNDSIQSHGVPRHCEEGAARRGNLYKNVVFRLALANSKKRKDNIMTKELVKENVTRQDDSRDAIPTPPNCPSCGRGSGCARVYECYNHRGRVFGMNNRNGNPPTLTLPLKGGREQVSNNSGTPQGLLNDKNLTSYRLNVLKTLRKAAFTLAEVLITLGVIGIVAAMTIPTLVNNYQKKLFVTKMKYTYSLLSNALALSVLENGNANTWNYGKSSDKASTGSSEDLTYIVNTYFKPYLKISEDIGVNAGGYHLVLNNGITLSFFTDGYINSETNIYTPTVIYIIAGNNKNTTSYSDSSRDYSRHDMFFEIVKINTLLTFCYGSRINREDIINDKQYGCNKTIAKNLRYNCGTLIKFDGWEIKDDYPW